MSQYTRVTDRQTDIILIAIQRLHYMQHGKNPPSALYITQMSVL